MFSTSLLVITLSISFLFLSSSTAHPVAFNFSRRGVQEVPQVGGSSDAGWQSLPNLQDATVHSDWSLGSGATIVCIQTICRFPRLN